MVDISIEEWLRNNNISGEALSAFMARFGQGDFNSEEADAWLRAFNENNIHNHSIVTNYNDEPVLVYVPPFTKSELYDIIDEYEPHYANKILDKFDKYPDMVMFLMEQKDENGAPLLNLVDVSDVLDVCGGTIEENPDAIIRIFNEENIRNIASAEIGARGDYISRFFDVENESVSEINEENLLPYGLLKKTISRVNSFCDQYEDIDPELRKSIIDTFVNNPNYDEDELYNLICNNFMQRLLNREKLNNLKFISDHFKVAYNENKEVYDEAFSRIDLENDDRPLENIVDELYQADLERRVSDVYDRHYSHPYGGRVFDFERQDEYDDRRDEHDEHENDRRDEHDEHENDRRDEHDEHENDRRNEHEGDEQELSHARRCLNAHQEFLAKRQMLIDRYPEVLNLGEVLDDIYRQALTEGKAPSITNNIKTYVGVNLSEEFIRDFNQMKYFVNRKGAEFVGDQVMRKVAKLDEPRTTEMIENTDLEAIDRITPLARDDNERKAIDGLVNINLAKESVLQAHPDVAEKLDSIVREVFVDGKQINDCSAMAELSDEVKADMAGFIEKIEANAALNIPDMVKLIGLSKDDVETLLDIKRGRSGELVIDEFILNRRNRDEEERDDHDEEERDDHDGEERDEHDEEEHDDHDGEERGDHDEEERGDHDGEERDDHDGEERDEHDEEEHGEHNEEEHDVHDEEERDEHDEEEHDVHDEEEHDEHDEGARDVHVQEHRRVVFSNKEFEKIESLNLSEEWRRKLDIRYDEGSNSYSMIIPENDDDKREFMNIVSDSIRHNIENEAGNGSQSSTPDISMLINFRNRLNR